MIPNAASITHAIGGGFGRKPPTEVRLMKMRPVMRDTTSAERAAGGPSDPIRSDPQGAPPHADSLRDDDHLDAVFGRKFGGRAPRHALGDLIDEIRGADRGSVSHALARGLDAYRRARGSLSQRIVVGARALDAARAGAGHARVDPRAAVLLDAARDRPHAALFERFLRGAGYLSLSLEFGLSRWAARLELLRLRRTLARDRRVLELMATR